MHKLLNDSPGEKIMLLGNEAIARGAIEAGVAFATTYPGTPSSEISLNLFQMSQESDFYFEYSTNEKVALEVAAAAANSGLRTFCMMKHVGLNVAADPLMTLAYVGVTGGMVILTADDPAMFSSQNEQDNRYYAKFGNLPMLEPSSVPEA
ncbi:MAG: indolepyruvate ferredoxin oxidoreductase subunit alpha, partial [Desulfobacula sp.]|nr:indolepyruvate ferredoxin oxidoreductase subunit alpha [Desulfobacula sp.]